MGRLFTKAQKAAIHKRQGGLCAIEGCEAEIAEYDHVLPWGLGGRSEEGNGEGLCIPCHKAKTAGDIFRIRKADRQAQCIGPKPPSRHPIKGRSEWPTGRKLRSRGFQKRERTDD